ncbi:G-protein coupled receptor 39 [Paramormyrops kingsleyae]|uniref:G protein-coupled receptor 39 n=1 Tax=Paramormyrops kingsleyae TaxID=1676925 RepID=A0A3B3T550_9TELE|nr:G-protein coupled receptor 39 [Paramormyrops kingsleyae]XP_023693543.1 G-protein coupled receptor 39 [Paramormyrops kingsleyae]
MASEYNAAMELKLKHWQELEYETPIKIFLTILYSTILVLGIVGNSITIKVTQVLLRKGYLQKNVTDHMVSLACSDLLVLLIGMPVELYSATWFPLSSTSGKVSCKIYKFLFEACSYSTILNVATLSFERYVAICHPLKYQSLSSARTVKLIIFVWVTSVLVALPLLYAMGTERVENILDLNKQPYQWGSAVNNSATRNMTFCTNLNSMWTMYRSSIFVAFIVYIVVLVSVGFMCRSMINVLSGTKRISSKAGDKRVEALPKHESSQARESRKQSIIFLGLIVGSLACCWMPNQIRRLMLAAKPKADWTATYLRAYVVLHPIADTFFYFSSVINPFLYNFSSRQFRQVFMQVLRCHLTIEHINRRNLRRPNMHSARRLLRSLRHSLPARGRDKASGTSTTLNTAHSLETSQEPSPEESVELSTTQNSKATSKTDI